MMNTDPTYKMIRKRENITQLPPDPYIELLKLNIQFAETHNKRYPNSKMKPRLPEEYSTIAVETYTGFYDVYYDENSVHAKIMVSEFTSYIRVVQCADAVIDKNNKVVKNRWGDES